METPRKLERLSDEDMEEMATTLRNNGQIKEAVRAYKELLGRFDAQGNVRRAANMQHMIGVSYKVANDTEASLSALADARQRYEQADDTVGVGRVLRDEGITYQYIHDFDKALPLLKQSVEILEACGDPAELGISEVKLGNLYMDQEDLTDAEAWIVRGLDTLRTRTDHWFYTATARMHLAELYFRKEEYGDALKEMGQVEEMFMKHGGESSNIRRLAQVEAMKALAYIRTGDKKAAEQSRLHCQELLDKLDDKSARYLREQAAFKEVLDEPK